MSDKRLMNDGPQSHIDCIRLTATKIHGTYHAHVQTTYEVSALLDVLDMNIFYYIDIIRMRIW